MKKTMLLLLIPVLGFSQIEIKSSQKTKKEIGRAEMLGYFLGSIDRAIYQQQGDTVFTICIRDTRYKSLVQIECAYFVGGNKDLQNVYSSIKSFWLPENKKNRDYQISIKLHDTNMYVTWHNKRLVSVFINNAICNFSQGQIEELFGKY